MIDDEISEIVPHLYLSNWYTSNNTRVLRENNIRGVITLETNTKPSEILNYYKMNNIGFLYVNIDDDPNANIYQYFDVSYNFIKDKISRGENVLVHCRAGVSRSATIVLNYLIRSYYQDSKIVSLTPGQVVRSYLLMVRKRRFIVNPNQGFMHQLLIKATEYNNEYRIKVVGIM